ncbi:hypothetical protein KUV51_18815 [Tateyamaria omphalii]|uniref:hypothetical protein n=1 Tax=Tateyamaria omphalii TaxID=299262 RepID=UPI001C9939AD|nr:hypothetical protein [Tateyamaria omphalii]MBY5935064.1 hypothetical protein [Tateyamaria omphalii]
MIYPVAPEVMANLGLMQFLVPMEGVDGDGRSLLEGRSIQNRPAQEDYRQCRYPGSRRLHAKPMNVKALSLYVAQRHTVDQWVGTMLAAQSADQSAALRFLFGTHTAYHTPKLWLHGPEDGPVPPTVATAAKICHGAYELALHCFRFRGPADFGRMDAEAMVRDAEEHKRLVGRSEVCAGPPAMIRDMLGLMLGEERAPIADATPEAACARRAAAIMHLYWRLERLAILNTFVALSRKRVAPGRVVTFPNAIRVIQAVQANQPLNASFVSAYQLVPPPEVDGLNEADRLLERHGDLWSRTPEEVGREGAASLGGFAADVAKVLDTLRQSAQTLGVVERDAPESAAVIDLLFGRAAP